MGLTDGETRQTVETGYPHDGHPATLQLIVVGAYRSDILAELHDSPTGGHYYWPGFSAGAKLWCSTCKTCAVRKTASPHQRAPLGRAGEPMQIVAVHILGPLPNGPAGNRYVLVAMDYLTKWAEAYAIPNQEATTVANKLVNEMSFQFSPPEQLHSDHEGRQFESTLVKEFANVLASRKHESPPTIHNTTAS